MSRYAGARGGVGEDCWRDKQAASHRIRQQEHGGGTVSYNAVSPIRRSEPDITYRI